MRFWQGGMSVLVFVKGTSAPKILEISSWLERVGFWTPSDLQHLLLMRNTLLMEESQTTTWNVEHLVNNGINYQPQLSTGFPTGKSGCHQQYPSFFSVFGARNHEFIPRVHCWGMVPSTFYHPTLQWKSLTPHAHGEIFNLNDDKPWV